MITTITTTVSSIASTDFKSSIVIVPVLVLVILLVQKEVTSTLHTGRARQLSQMLDVALVPLMGVCFVTVILGVRSLLH